MVGCSRDSRRFTGVTQLKFRLLHAGSAARGALGEAADDYRSRLNRHPKATAEEHFVKPVKLRREMAADIQKALATEGERIAKKLDSNSFVIALDRCGKQLSSPQVAAALERAEEMGRRSVTLLLGSSHGLDHSLVAQADLRWSFGPLTLPHDLARVVLWEQLFRARAIRDGNPYHK